MEYYSDFFKFCEEKGMVDDKSIACYFYVTKQTVKNWRKNAIAGKKMPNWMRLKLSGYQYAHKDGYQPYCLMPIQWFEQWRERHNLKTLQQTGEVFGVTRQAVHSWGIRGRLPRWITLSCIGYEIGLEAA